jgi:hypothetical protein
MNKISDVYVSYGLLGLSSLILGYYTLFDNKMDEVVPEPIPVTQEQEPATQEPATLEPATQEPATQEQEPATQELAPMQGGKKKKNTRKAKKQRKTKTTKH